MDRFRMERAATIMAGRKGWLCEDWSCPAHRSCARHFGRSDAYAAMSLEHPPLVIPVVTEPAVEHDGLLIELAREPEHDWCEFYERDGFKGWLVAVGDGRQAIDTPPGWMMLGARRG